MPGPVATRSVVIALALSLGPILAGASFASAAALPSRVGQCSETTIKSIGYRLIGARGSGSAVTYDNGGYQVSYETVPGIRKSRRGDRVRLCLVELPVDCPKGDARGKIYKATNLRTGATWELADAEHGCGGA
jgi:hypothetical protein